MTNLPAVRQETLIGRKPAVLAELQRRTKQGTVVRAGELRLLTQGQHAGQYAIPVMAVVQAPPPVWAVRARAAGWVLLGLAALVGSLAWLLATLSAAALAGACITLLVTFSVWVKAKYGRGRGHAVEVVSVTRVRIR